jgi:hypothetical protein
LSPYGTDIPYNCTYTRRPLEDDADSGDIGGSKVDTNGDGENGYTGAPNGMGREMGNAV